MPTRRGWKSEQRRSFLLGLIPALAVLVFVSLGPVLYLGISSLTPLNPTVPGSGWDFSRPWQNYTAAIGDERFLLSVWIQVKLSVATVIGQIAIGLGLALLLDSNSRLMEAIRTGFLLPMVLPPIVVAVVWKIVFTPDISPMHRLLEWAGFPVHSLLSNGSTALWAVVAADTWEWFPFTLLMMLAALQMVPREPMEAAAIDGASWAQTFWYVRLPFIRPTLSVTALFRLIDSIKAFPLIYVLTDGGPGRATEVTNYYAFVQTFNFSFWGYGSAVATLLVAGVLALSWIILRSGHANAGGLDHT
jgi:multiple sugar transport system permease protein